MYNLLCKDMIFGRGYVFGGVFMDWEHLSLIIAFGILQILAIIVEFIFYMILRKRSQIEYSENHYVCMYDMIFVKLIAVAAYIPAFINFFMLLVTAKNNTENGMKYQHSVLFFILTAFCVSITWLMVRQWVEVTDTMVVFHGSNVIKSIDMMDLDMCERGDAKFVLKYQGQKIMTMTPMFNHQNRFELDLIRCGRLDGVSSAYVRNLEKHVDE